MMLRANKTVLWSEEEAHGRNRPENRGRNECRAAGVFNLGNRRLSVAGEYFLDRLWNGRRQRPVRFHVAPRGGLQHEKDSLKKCKAISMTLYQKVKRIFGAHQAPRPTYPQAARLHSRQPQRAKTALCPTPPPPKLLSLSTRPSNSGSFAGLIFPAPTAAGHTRTTSLPWKLQVSSTTLSCPPHCLPHLAGPFCWHVMPH